MRLAAPLLTLALISCQVEYPSYDDPRPITPGAPVVGAAEAPLELPLGTPLSGFTSRCTCLGGSLFDADDRRSNYAYKFIESTGVHTTPTVKAIWVENGDDHLVLIKTDTIYSYEGLVDGVTELLEEATGEELTNKVVHTANHSHSGWGSFSDQKGFFLGSDKYNEEIYQRFIHQMADVAVEAYETKVPAKIGMGWALEWDPDNRVYRDRRGINNELIVWDDQAEWVNGKDQHVALMRFDTLEDEPIAMTVTFGMHGILLDTDSTMASGDSGLAVEHALQEQFDDEVVVMFTQGAGGDASPAGSDGGYAKHEALGYNAVEPLMDLWANTPTSADPITLETAARTIPTDRDDIHVSRGGDVDWYYTPHDPETRPDDIIYEQDSVSVVVVNEGQENEYDLLISGDIVTPIDEFNTAYGAVFCGSGDFDVPVGQIESDVFPYTYCMQVDLMSRLVLAFFDLEEEEIPLPLPHTVKAGTAATKIGGLTVMQPDGSVGVQDQLIGYFPGEATAMYVENWRRRTQKELGFNQSLMISYSQDHEGYLLIPEDWLLGEYEADITFWGPLGGEHIMEGVITMVDEVLMDDVHQDPDPWKMYQSYNYPDNELPTVTPDPTPDAGTLLDAIPTWDEPDDPQRPEKFWLPIDFVGNVDIPEEVPRVQGSVQMAWKGGDPAVDFPNVVLQRDNNGTWETVLTHSGREVDESFADILVAWTPDPLYPAEALQEHYWWANWQAVAHHHDRAGLPLGTYRLHVTGEKWVGTETTWPWTTETYEVSSDPFEVVAADLDLELTGDGIWATLRGPSDGYRLIANEGGNYRGNNPIVGPALVAWRDAQGERFGGSEITPTRDESGRTLLEVSVPKDAVEAIVEDAYGNVGTLPVNL